MPNRSPGNSLVTRQNIRRTAPTRDNHELDIIASYSELGITSESQFKTLKYRPDFPDRFDSIEAARRHCQIFFGWYNDEHRHTGLALHTPADVHYGTAAITRDKRTGVLDAAYAAHPERFVRKPPQPP